jgi:hypothetical protein
MARPIKRTPGGPWSLVQLGVRTGVHPSQIRRMTRAGWIDPTQVTEVDAITVMVGACLLGALPSWASPASRRDEVQVRDRATMQLARDMAHDPATTATALILVTLDGVQAVSGPAQLLTAMGGQITEPVMLIPVGQWIHALRAESGVAS